MQRVIGLDIGSYSIKVVEILNTFNSYEIVNFYENVIPHFDEVPPDVIIPSCMEQLFSENNLQADRIITAMPGQYISSRIMPFDFSDPRKIENAVLAEIEDVVPYNMDDMIIDHQIIGQINDQTIAMAVMTRKIFLKSFLDHLQRVNIDPKLVDVDSLAFYNLNPFLASDPDQCAAIVDVGHEKTSVCIVQGEVLRMFRSINLGGRYLTEFLTRDLEVSFNEAQRIKHRISHVLYSGDDGAHLSPEDRMIAYRMTLATNALVKELGRTFYSFKKWERAPISKIFLSGGTSVIKNIEHYLAEQLEIPVVKNYLSQSTLKINPDLQPRTAVMPQSVSIGLRAVSSIKRHTQINLRKDEFAYVQDYEFILNSAGAIARYAALALVFLCVAYVAQNIFYNRQIDKVQQAYTKKLATIFPDVAKSSGKNATFDKIVSTANSKFKTETEAARMAVEQFQKTMNSSPPLELLASISKSMPKEIKLDVTNYQFTSTPDGGGKILFRGDTDSYDSVAKVVEALKKLPQLSNVEEKNSSAKPGYDNKVIDFTLQAVYTGAAGEAAKG